MKKAQKVDFRKFLDPFWGFTLKTVLGIHDPRISWLVFGTKNHEMWGTPMYSKTSIISGRCHGMMVGIERTCSQKDCLGACQHSSQCNYFTYDAKTQFCEMLSDCKFIDDTCKTCVSGEDQCSVNYLADAFGDY